MDEKVQLSRETIVGDDVVSEDIYPNTNTKSVNDDQSGTSLNETIERIWAAINNKLARIVNSVNGRTGVVVLDSSDVGLENVDNVSFNDIKSWVIDELTKQFGYKQIKLFDNQSELSNCIAQHNLDDLFAPFYTEHWNSTDTRPHIGCIILDPNDSSLLNYMASPICGIGMTDESLVYKDTDDDAFHPEMRGGELRVKISSEEKALYVNREGTDDEKGLKIDSSMISGVLHFYDGIYGVYRESPYQPGKYIFEGGLLSTEAEEPGTHTPYPPCSFSLNGKLLNPPLLEENFYLKDLSIHKNDTIVCNFKDYRIADGPLYTLNSEKHYVKLVKTNPDDKQYNYEYSGDGYRVGDIIDTVDDAEVTAKFIVTSIKDGAFEGPIATVNLLYCEPIQSSQRPTIPAGGTLIDTKPIVRYMSHYNDTGFPEPVDPTGTSDNYVSIYNTSSASGFSVYLEDDDCFTPSKYQIPPGTHFSLMMRGMCIGRVLYAPDRLNPDTPYHIDFYSLRPLVGNSLQYKTYDREFHEDQFSEVMEIKTRKGHVNSNGLWNETLDISGIAIAENWGQYRHDGKSARIVPYDGNSLVEPNRMKRTAVLPGGPVDIMPNDQASVGGITIMTDLSLCIIPHDICVQESDLNSVYGSKYAVNWSASLPYTYPTYEKDTPSYIGVNLFKVIKPKSLGRLSETEESLYYNQLYMFNMSGLRVVDTRDKLTKSLVGKTDDNYINTPDNPITDEQLESYSVSGGLMVNVGEGLEIRAHYDVNEQWNQYSDHPFDDSGKVCIRVDDETIEVNNDNRLHVRVGKGLQVSSIGGGDRNKCIQLYVDHSFVFTGTNEDILSLDINSKIYHETDMMSNVHPIMNLLQNKTSLDRDIPLSAYINTKYGLGLSITGNGTFGSTDDPGAPNALIIRIKANDVGYVTDDDTEDLHTEYRSRLVALKNDGLMFDPDGKLTAPIDTSRGLTNNYSIKAMSSDENGNVTTKETGGIGINVGSGLTFDSDGKLTLEADNEIKKLRNGFDLNNLVTGNYYADDATSDSIDHRPTTGLGVFRVEHKPVIADSGYYIQKLYSFEKLGIVYMRYKKNNSWTGWYHIDGQIID